MGDEQKEKRIREIEYQSSRIVLIIFHGGSLGLFINVEVQIPTNHISTIWNVLQSLGNIL